MSKCDRISAFSGALMLGDLIDVYPDTIPYNDLHQDAAGVWEYITKTTIGAGVSMWSCCAWCQRVALKAFEQHVNQMQINCC